MGGEVEFFQTFLDGARVPDSQRVGAEGQGWKVAQATLSGERQMVSGTGSGGVDRIGGASTRALVRLARQMSADGLPGGWDDPRTRDRLVRLYCEERARAWTNQRVRAGLAAGRAPGAESSIGKVHASELNQRIQAAAADLLCAACSAAGRTRSRAAPARSTATCSPSGCSGCPRSPIPGGASHGANCRAVKVGIALDV
jgi:alkylation response protein AidB-like acyl-CoA dehydrogenase